MTKASPAPFTGRGPALPPSRRTISVGIIGLGTVGTGTVKVLVEHQRELERRLGWKLQLKTICSRSIHKRDLSWLRQPVNTTRDWRQVVADPKVDIVVELVGELRTARAIANAALGAGKHLVTANKQLVAEHGVELVERSQAARVNLGIEACVAGGTPVLHAIREGLAAENFVAVYGILNGTTNYILTEMERSGCDFREALAEAQEKGYAEPDPTFDIEGYDARYKGAIPMITGRGAGGEATAVAVLSDVVEIGRAMAAGGGSTTPLGYTTWHPARSAPSGENVIAAYLRLVVRDQPGILARVCAVLARHRINIDSVLQEPGLTKKHLPFVMTLEPMREKLVRRAISEIARLPFLAAPPLLLPFADLP